MLIANSNIHAMHENPSTGGQGHDFEDEGKGHT